MSSVSCIIIEDERPAQEVLKSYIAKTDWLTLSGVFDDAGQPGTEGASPEFLNGFKG